MTNNNTNNALPRSEEFVQYLYGEIRDKILCYEDLQFIGHILIGSLQGMDKNREYWRTEHKILHTNFETYKQVTERQIQTLEQKARHYELLLERIAVCETIIDTYWERLEITDPNSSGIKQVTGAEAALAEIQQELRGDNG